MASRDKKLNVGRKSSASSPPRPSSAKEDTPIETVLQSATTPAACGSENPAVALSSSSSVTVLKPVRKSIPVRKKVIHKKIKVNLKNKNKKVVNKKLVPQSKTDAVVKVVVSPLKNGVASKVIKKKTATANSVRAAEKRKRNARVEPPDLVRSTIESVVSASIGKSPKRMRRSLTTTIAPAASVATDINCEIKKEPPDEMPTETIVENADKRRSSKKQKLIDSKVEKFDTKKKIKKENIDQVLNTVDTSSYSNVIDSLGLFTNRSKTQPLIIRRHSIAKFPITHLDVRIRDKSAFTSVVLNKRPKRLASRSRLSSESKRASPYTTRSDSPMRILRNGKHRKFKQFPLFDGLDSEYKMRRRLASDFSGSSEFTKGTGYESDSSYSDMASTNENTDADKELQLKKDILEALENNPPDTAEGKKIVENFSAVIKRSLSMDAPPPQVEENKTIDTNSNLCSVLDQDAPLKAELDSEIADEAFKVPEKNLLLGIMKQTFNDSTESTEKEIREVERRKTRSSSKKAKSPDEDNSATSAIPSNVVASCSTSSSSSSTVTVLNAAGLSFGPEITVTAEEVRPPDISEKTTQEAEEELVEILQKLTDEDLSMNGDANHAGCEEPKSGTSSAGSVKNSPECSAEKSQILKALGLQTLQEAEETRKKQVPKTENYTGTLKTVIKLNRGGRDDKKKRTGIKMTLQKKGKSGKDEENLKYDEDEYKIMKEGSSGWKAFPGGQSSDTAGAQRKSHYSNRSNMDGSSEHTSDGDTNVNEEGGGGGGGKLLVIPEKASSFSIHPGRLCKDECSYCFGKFGLFDTPCHIAQMKSVERQDKILDNERHLTRDSCLCDACYRHVDRKANMRTLNKNVKKHILVAPAPRENHCHVLGCNLEATNILKRRWLIRMRKDVCQVINIDLDNPGLHSIPVCKEHYAAVEHLMDCTMCKRKLAGNHIHYLGMESRELNVALNKMNIPVKLNDKPVVCKLCRYFASLVLKGTDEQSITFFDEYKKRLLHFHNVELMNENEADEPIMAPSRESNKQDNNPSKKRKKMSAKNHNAGSHLSGMHHVGHSNVMADDRNVEVPSSDSRPESPSEYLVDYKTLIPNVAIECMSDSEDNACRELSKKPSLSIRRISKSSAQDKKRMQKSEIAVQRLGSNPSISVRQLFPGEEDVPLNGFIEFNNMKEKTPEGWEKCVSTIQYDPEIKMLWNELQKPYGNQSSFLRHLILLEKYFRNGDLILSPTAGHHSTNYTDSVQNRLRAYDNISSNAANKPVSTLPCITPKPLPPSTFYERNEVVVKEKCNNVSLTPLPLSSSTPHNNVAGPAPAPLKTSTGTPLTITQTITNNLNQIANSQPSTSTSQTAQLSHHSTTTNVKSKPPGLISLQNANSKNPNKSPKPQSQKIKFPITKNWRPNLIPIDPSAKPEKKPGLVQVISGGKPYHITVEDYKKMCAIKRTFDLRQKRLQETLRSQINSNPNSLLKTISQRKSISISKSPSSNTSEQDQDEQLVQEKLELKPGLQHTTVPTTFTDTKLGLNLPKIPKSLTVIPQTVKVPPATSAVAVKTNTSRPTSPAAQQLAKPKPSKS